jgi:hypothetical protein
MIEAADAQLEPILRHILYIIDDETPQVNFAAESSEVNEDSNAIQVTLNLDHSPTETVTVLYERDLSVVLGVIKASLRGLLAGVINNHLH